MGSSIPAKAATAWPGQRKAEESEGDNREQLGLHQTELPMVTTLNASTPKPLNPKCNSRPAATHQQPQRSLKKPR